MSGVAKDRRIPDASPLIVVGTDQGSRVNMDAFAADVAARLAEDCVRVDVADFLESVFATSLDIGVETSPRNTLGLWAAWLGFKGAEVPDELSDYPRSREFGADVRTLLDAISEGTVS